MIDVKDFRRERRRLGARIRDIEKTRIAERSGRYKDLVRAKDWVAAAAFDVESGREAAIEETYALWEQIDALTEALRARRNGATFH